MAISARGDVIKALRKNKSLTQKEFADKCALSDRTIKDIEKGKPVKLSSIKKVADALGVDIEYLTASDSISAEYIIYDTTANIMEKIYNLDRFVKIVKLNDTFTIHETPMSPATRGLLELARRLYGPFEPAKNRELVPPIYYVD